MGAQNAKETNLLNNRKETNLVNNSNGISNFRGGSDELLNEPLLRNGGEALASDKLASDKLVNEALLKDKPIKIIKELAKELIEQMTVKTQEFRLQLNKTRETYNLEERERMEKVEVLTKKIEEAKRRNELLLERREDLQEKLRKDVEELGGIEKENGELQRQINELKIVNKSSVDRKEALDQRLMGVSGRYSVMRNKELIKAKDQALINENYRVFFGMSIVRCGRNMIKMVFDHIGVENYVIFDFSEKGAVREVSGGLSVERLNVVFAEMGSFCRFVKYLREELKRQ